jgi:hypothetical protein
VAGPRDQSGRLVYDPTSGHWPAVGSVIVAPMYRWTRPPYSIKPTVAYNPILIDPAQSADPRWGRPLLLNPDPQPGIVNGWPGTVDGSNWSEYVQGDTTPVGDSLSMSWFRIRRVSAATFLITCGAGGTMGFKDWSEVVAANNPAGRISGALGGTEMFNNDPAFFEELRVTEVRTWYEVRWLAAVKPLDFRYEEAVWWGGWLQNAFAYRIYPVNGSQYTGWGRANRFNPNPVGTINYIQRLESSGTGPVSPAGLPIALW